MKAIYTILFLLCLALFAGHAQPVSIEKAKQAGVAFFNGWKTTDAKNTSSKVITTKETVQTGTWKQRNRDCMYVINFPDNGWVLVSGDERAMPILAMSDNGTFPNREDMPPAMLVILENYADEIMFIQDSVPDALTHPDWQALEKGTYLKQSRNIDNGNGSSLYTPGTGLLNRPHRGEVRWNQQGHDDYGWDNIYDKPIYDCNYSYNKFCPKWHLADGQCGTYVGCTAVAMAQIMWYWQWPHTGYIHSGIDQNGNGIGAMELHLYDWNKMPAYLTPGDYIAAIPATPMDEVDMVAGFLRDCGYAAKMKYGEDGSSSNHSKAKDAFINTFSYSSDIQNKVRMLTVNWDKKIRDEINSGRPVMYRGQKNNEGHDFVIDGYDAADPSKFHVNWGYSGRYNLYCTFDDLGFIDGYGETIKYDNFQTALFGIKPAPACGAADINGGNNYRVGQAGAVTVSNVTVPSGTTAVYYSGTSVTLRPGFKATAGSHTHIAIQNFPCNGIAPASLDPIGLKSVYAEPETGGSTGLNLDYVQGTSIYPNPTDGALYVQTSREVARIELYGLSGEKLLESRETTLDLHGLQEGMYVLMVHFADGTVHSEKVIRNQ